ncbi:MAG TPA: metallophosphoesterase [Gammaproteobacteria bacterium]|nr:metallophosphoesterase [Gammaproteobacteria bacterium]
MMNHAMASGRVQRLALNRRGRDYVVGDIHGEFPRLEEALSSLGFEPDRDRLFCTGDLVDRGPCSGQAGEWIARPWFHSVLGNHERMLLDACGDPRLLASWLHANGGQWWLDLDENERHHLLEAFRRLPLAMEIATAAGPVGVVHADVPPWLDWPQLTAALASGDAELEHYLLWERRRISFMDRRPVAGIHRVYCGHTPVDRPRRLGNVYFIDTGICFGGDVHVLPLGGDP